MEALVAGSPSDDRPGQHANGKISRQHQEITPLVGGDADEQSVADSEQTLGDSDQTLSDCDESSAERDQTSADSDQVASDRDQAASDRDLALGVDPVLHEASRAIRRRGAHDREETASARLQSAGERDATAHARDIAALARDQAAATRDLAMAQRDADYARDDQRAVTAAEIVMRAADQRRRAAQHRAQAAEHRAQAAADREAAARDREQGARDRMRALADRDALARALAITETDALTGARSRAAGLRDLEHEVERCRRTGGCLVVAYVDAVGLKRINDNEGHAAGDAMLVRVVAAIRRHVRAYDLIVRLGGDEFACVMSNVMLADARERFGAIASALAASSDAIRTGFAELTSNETAAELIARADGQLVDSRR
jgi:diguanylate cyclase (GGDEF)-like protein